MTNWLLQRSTPRLRLLFRALMLVLIGGGVLGRGAEASAHCTRHGPAMRAAHLDRTPRQSTDWSGLAPSGHQCPHCPPAECATALPCASGPSSQSAPGTGPAVPGLAVRSLRELTPAQGAASLHAAPPTPPPQAAA